MTDEFQTNGMAFHVSEANYRAFGYEPDFDNLPWKRELQRGNGNSGGRACAVTLRFQLSKTEEAPGILGCPGLLP
jgi:hypothetical protein